jgi:hypothetical protein
MTPGSGHDRAADRLTILFSRQWAEGGYLRCPYNREGGFRGCGVRREVPVLDGSIVQLVYSPRRAP